MPVQNGFFYRLNKILNRNHNWFDYTTSDELEEKQWRWFGGAASTGKDHNGTDYSESEYEDPTETALGKGVNGLTEGLSGVFGQLPELINSLVAYYGHNTLTGAEQEQNEFNAAEAQKSRDFTEYMARNKYSMETQSMQEAGINPAMVYGGGNLVSTSSNGAQATGSAGSGGDLFGALTTMMRLPLEMKKMEQDIKESESREKKNYIDAHGADLQNKLTETTWTQIVEKSKLDNDDLRASINLKKAQADTEEEKKKLTIAETLLTEMDKSQREQMFPLLMHAQELTNAYQETANKWQERQIRADLNRTSAQIKQLLASALLAGEQAKYAGRMTLGQVIGTWLNGHPEIGDAMLDQSPIGWLINLLGDALGDGSDGTGGSTSPTGGDNNFGTSSSGGGSRSSSSNGGSR